MAKKKNPQELDDNQLLDAVSRVKKGFPINPDLAMEVIRRCKFLNETEHRETPRGGTATRTYLSPDGKEKVAIYCVFDYKTATKIIEYQFGYIQDADPTRKCEFEKQFSREIRGESNPQQIVRAEPVSIMGKFLSLFGAKTSDPEPTQTP